MITPGKTVKPEYWGKSMGVEAWQCEPFGLAALALSWVYIIQQARSSAFLLLSLSNKTVEQPQPRQIDLAI